MLVSDSISPAKMLYYQGGRVLQLLQKEGNMSVGILYTRVQEEQDMSFPMLMLCLDWLYLIDAAIITKEGEVRLCS